MLTETQWEQLDETFRKTSLGIKMLAKDAAYVVADAYHNRISQEIYTSHADAALALINGTYTPLTVRVDTCVQHGAKNKPQWARKTQAKVNVMNGGSL